MTENFLKLKIILHQQMKTKLNASLYSTIIIEDLFLILLKHHITRLSRKNISFEWAQECENAFGFVAK